MHIGQIVRTGVVALLCLFSGACATQENSKAGKGHWETLPLVTGSMIQRKVWVDENGNISSPADAGNVQGHSAAGLERIQRTSGATRPPGQ
jgi:hypothetical protein